MQCISRENEDGDPAKFGLIMIQTLAVVHFARDNQRTLTVQTKGYVPIIE